MYDEDSFNKHIAWMKFKRVFLLLFFSVLGCIIGIAVSFYLIELVMLPSFVRIPIIAGSTLLLFFLSLISTAKITTEIQDGYWKIAVLRKLTLISKKLDSLESVGKLENLDYLKTLDENISETLTEMKQRPASKTVKFKKVASKKVY